EAGSRRRHPIAPAASASSAAASGGGRSRRPILAEASSSGLLSHIRQRPGGLLPADRGLRVNYDAQTGRGRLRLTAPRAEIIPRSSGPVPQTAPGLSLMPTPPLLAGSRRRRRRRSDEPPPATAAAPKLTHGVAAPGWSLYGDYLSEGPPSGGNYRHCATQQLPGGVSDTETDPNRRYQPLRGPQPHVPQHQPQQPLYQNQHRLPAAALAASGSASKRQPHSRFSTHQTLV
uniref:ZM domain-containing protein n=1 Tax=Macrostomum lignano TaxID=282301 RepID=A0A1I8F7G9_9PLAT